MSREHDSRKDRSSSAPDASEHVPSPSSDPRVSNWNAIVAAATRWNAAHPELVAEFHRLTGGKCAGDNAGVSVRAVRRWQMDHGLTADGRVGPKTVDAAKKEATVSFGEDEADTITAKPAHLGGDKNAELADQVVAGGQTGGEEKRETADTGETLGEGGSSVKEGGEKGAEAAGVAEGEGPRADILKHDANELGASEALEEGAEEHSAGAKVGLSVAVRLALVPQIVHLLREHQIKEALHVVWKSVGWEERAELVKYVAEKVGGELSRHAFEIFEKAAMVGAVADVLQLGWEWTYGGLKAIAEAHEKGDRDSRIAIYAYAWSDTVMTGHHSNPGAIDAEQIEAKQRGIEDGKATRELSPDLASLLLAQYGDDPDNARRALEDALLKRAGISGIRTHHG